MSTDTTTSQRGSTEADGEISTPAPAEGAAESEPEARTLPLDIVFEIIRNERRRLVLDFLEEADGDTTLSELAEHIAAIENETTVQGLSAQQRKRVYVGLYQCHLPKMADSGIVEFNKNRGLIRPGPNVAQLQPYLDVDETATDSPRDAIILGSIAVIGYLLAAFGGLTATLAGGVVVFTTIAIFGFFGLREYLDRPAA